MYSYDGGKIWADRNARGTDHCHSSGPVFELSTLISSGVIRDPDNRSKVLSTKRAATFQSSRLFIFAVDEKYQMNVAFDTTRDAVNAVKHETLFHNAPVRAAGEIDLLDGIIVSVNDHSGTYQTYGMIEADRNFAAAVIDALDRAKIPIDPHERNRLRRKAGLA